MDKLMFFILIVMFIFITVKNLSVFSRFKRNKEYIESYKQVLHNDENCYEKICDYVEKEKALDYKNKAAIIKLYCELNNDLDYQKTLDSIDIKAIFYKNEKLNNDYLKYNSDFFIFAMLVQAKAFEKSKIDVIEILVNKLNELTLLDSRLEIKLFNELGKALTNKEDKGLEFMRNLIDGNYSEYTYDKNMIGLYKRVAASILAFHNEEFDEYFKNDLHNFSGSIIGACFLRNLGIYETYKPIEEEVTEDENKENVDSQEVNTEEEANKE